MMRLMGWCILWARKYGTFLFKHIILLNYVVKIVLHYKKIYIFLRNLSHEQKKLTASIYLRREKNELNAKQKLKPAAQ
jgi:hypothetical protein